MGKKEVEKFSNYSIIHTVFKNNISKSNLTNIKKFSISFEKSE